MLLCDAIVKSVTLKPLPRQAHGDAGIQAATAAAFVRRLQLGLQSAPTALIPLGTNSGSSSNSPAGSGACNPAPGTLSLGFKGFTPSELAAWLQGPFGSGPPLPAVEQLILELAAGPRGPLPGPFLDSMDIPLLEALAALVPNIRRASFQGVLPVGLGPALARHCRQLTSLDLHATDRIDWPPPVLRPNTAHPPGSITQITQMMLSGLASLPSLESLTFKDSTDDTDRDGLPNSRRPLPDSFAGPATLRTLVWKAAGWDWHDVALMERVSAALPHLASLELTFPSNLWGNLPHPESPLRGCFPNLTHLTLPQIDRICWHSLAQLPALRSG